MDQGSRDCRKIQDVVPVAKRVPASLNMNRRNFLVAGGAVLASYQSQVAGSSASSVTLGVVSLSFYRVTGEVVREILERLGHRVEIREGTHEELFALLGGARIDLLAAVWLPEGHASYWARYGADAMEIATFYEGARFFWGVPDYVPETDVASIADLERPHIAQRMTREIQGIGAGASISVLSRQAIGTYGLDTRGYTFQSGSQAQWLAALRAAIAEKRWIVCPMWTPLFLNHGGGLRPLRDPQGILGGDNRASLVGPRELFETFPERTRQALARITLDIGAVTEMDWEVNVRNQTPRDAALGWMAAHEDRVSSWIDGHP